MLFLQNIHFSCINYYNNCIDRPIKLQQQLFSKYSDMYKYCTAKTTSIWHPMYVA